MTFTNQVTKANRTWRDRSGIALPNWHIWLAGSLSWGLVMLASACVVLWQYDWLLWSNWLRVMALFSLGGICAFAPALTCVGLLNIFWPLPPTKRFAATFLFLSCLTISVTTLMFVIAFRDYFSQWHAPAFTITWFYQTTYTSIGAIYHFFVTGLRYFLPIGFPCLIIVSYWQALQSKEY